MVMKVSWSDAKQTFTFEKRNLAQTAQTALNPKVVDLKLTKLKKLNQISVRARRIWAQSYKTFRPL